MQVIINHDGICGDGQLDGLWVEQMFMVIVHGIGGRYKSRNMPPRLTRQIVINIPEIFFPSGPPDCLVDITGTTIIGRNHQGPVSIDPVKILHKAGRCMG